MLLSSIKHAKSIELEAKSDFGKGCHTRSTEPYFYEAVLPVCKGFLIPVNGEGKCVVARAHPESDSATNAGTNRCPQGVPKMSQIRSVGSGNVLHNANH